MVFIKLTPQEKTNKTVQYGIHNMGWLRLNQKN